MFCLRLFLPLFAAFIALASHAKEDMTVFAPSCLTDPKMSSYVMAEVDHVGLEDLDHLQLATPDGRNLIALDPNRSAEVTVFLPDGMDKADEDAFVAAVEQRLNPHYSHAVYHVRRAYIPQSVLKEEQENQNPIKVTGGVYERWRARTIQLAREIHEGMYRPETADLAAGTVIGTARTIGFSGAWLAVSGLNPYGLGQSLFTLILNEIFSMFPNQINNWKINHQFPYFKNSLPVRIYNNNPYIKTALVNESMTTAIQSTLEYLSYKVNPAESPSPFSKQWIKFSLSVSVWRGPLGAAEDLGVFKIVKKGYIDRRASHYLLILFSLQSQLSSLFMSGGKSRFLWPVLTLEFATKLLTVAFAELAPPISNRVYVLHPGVNDANRQQFTYVHDLRDVYLTNARRDAKEMIEKHHLNGLKACRPVEDESEKKTALAE